MNVISEFKMFFELLLNVVVIIACILRNDRDLK